MRIKPSHNLKTHTHTYTDTRSNRPRPQGCLGDKLWRNQDRGEKGRGTVKVKMKMASHCQGQKVYRAINGELLFTETLCFY